VLSDDEIGNKSGILDDGLSDEILDDGLSDEILDDGLSDDEIGNKYGILDDGLSDEILDDGLSDDEIGNKSGILDDELSDEILDDGLSDDEYCVSIILLTINVKHCVIISLDTEYVKLLNIAFNDSNSFSEFNGVLVFPLSPNNSLFFRNNLLILS
jgi:hypothetical protein